MDSSDAPSRLREGNWFQRRIGRRADDLAAVAEPFCAGIRWLPTALVIGIGPFLVSWTARLPGHQFVSAILLAWVTAACARRDAWAKGMALITLAFVAHCGTVIFATVQLPARTAQVIPGGDEYWQKQITWIETGEDPEYDPWVWIPNHLILFVGTVIWSAFSLGAVTFQRGFHEVDLMNYYNGQLLLHSENRPAALALGWHFWSLLRGAAYVVLTYELISLGLRGWTGIAHSTTRRRACRWASGITLLLADGLVKYALMESVRDAMFQNLS